MQLQIINKAYMYLQEKGEQDNKKTQTVVILFKS